MANVLITNQCNRSCSYCFARQEMHFFNPESEMGGKMMHMSLSNLDKVIGFFKRSNMTRIGILGGEPTLHPQFCEVIGRVLKAGLQVNLFTGGLFSNRVKSYLKTLDPKKVTIMFNVSCTNSNHGNGEWDQIATNTHDLAPLATLGYTIYDIDTDLTFLADLVTAYRCRPRIRLGIGVPIIDADHPLIHPKTYKLLAQNILRLAERCDKHDIALQFDCGFTLCMFTPEELGYLRVWNCDAKFVCSPIVDIGPYLDVWPCFPMAKVFKRQLSQFASRQGIIEKIIQKTQPYRTFGVHDDCYECKYKKRGQCAGGCLAHTIRSFH